MTAETTTTTSTLRKPPRPPRPIVCPFIVVVDTRENLPFTFTTLRADAAQRRRPLIIPTVRRGLPTGDYSVVGYDGTFTMANGLRTLVTAPAGVCVERKGVADLFNTVGQSRARFTRELERLNAFDVAAVVVEADWTEILASAGPPVRSQLCPKSLWRSVLAWQQRFPRVHWHMCAGRAFAEVTTFRILERYWRDRQRVAGVAAKDGAGAAVASGAPEKTSPGAASNPCSSTADFATVDPGTSEGENGSRLTSDDQAAQIRLDATTATSIS